MLSCDSRNNPISDSVWQRVRPLLNSLIGDADCFGDRGDGAPQEFDGFCLAHAALNHSSWARATIVHDGGGSLSAVSTGDYKDRFAEAMRLSGKSTHDIAEALGVSYQAIKKIELGTSKMLKADHNSVAAKCMGVSAEWLATGDGCAVPAPASTLSLAAQELAARFDEVPNGDEKLRLYARLLNEIRVATPSTPGPPARQPVEQPTLSQVGRPRTAHGKSRVAP